MADPEQAKRCLVAFLLSHRLPDQPMHQWLAEFRHVCLDEALADEPTLRDENAMLAELAAAFAPAGPLAGWTVLRTAGQGGAPDHLNLITLHSAKGLEFRVVVLMGMEQGRMPHWSADEGGKREARRLFYVGLTRAQDEVHMTFSGWTSNRYGRRFNNGPSEFLVEVRDRLGDVTD